MVRNHSDGIHAKSRSLRAKKSTSAKWHHRRYVGVPIITWRPLTPFNLPSISPDGKPPIPILANTIHHLANRGCDPLAESHLDGANHHATKTDPTNASESLATNFSWLRAESYVDLFSLSQGSVDFPPLSQGSSSGLSREPFAFLESPRGDSCSESFRPQDLFLV